MQGCSQGGWKINNKPFWEKKETSSEDLYNLGFSHWKWILLSLCTRSGPSSGGDRWPIKMYSTSREEVACTHLRGEAH